MYITKVSPKNKKLTDIRLVDLDDLSVQAFQTEFLCRYGDKVVTESSNNLKAQPRSNRGRRGKGKGSKGSGSTNNSPGSSDARDDHPLSATAASYSGAVKRNVGEKDMGRRRQQLMEPMRIRKRKVEMVFVTYKRFILYTVEFSGTDTSLLRTVSNVPTKFSYIFLKK